jgi:hypothetical protein
MMDLRDILPKADVFVSGCSGCAITDAPIGIYYVAQGNTPNRIAIKYSIHEDCSFTRESLGHIIENVARRNGLETDWNASPDKSVILKGD